MTVKQFLANLILFVTTVGCASSATDFASQFDPMASPDLVSNLGAEKFNLGPGDLVRVAVFGVAELDGEYQIDYDGNIDFPLLGVIPAANKTSSQLAHELEYALGEKYLRDPEVQVSIIEAAVETITVDGSVKKPGVYDLQGQMSLMQAIALAGGPSNGANLKKVLIFRQLDGQRMAAAFNLKEIRDGDAADPRVYGNDILVMDGTGDRSRYEMILRATPVLGVFRFF